MPIQFHCNKCQGWIEVDDEYAGGKAICPFCQAVNDVPGEPRKAPATEPTESQKPKPTEEGAEGKGPYTGVPTEPTRPGAPEVPVSKPIEQRERESGWHGRATGDLGRFNARRAGLPPVPGSLRLARVGMAGLAAAILSIVLMTVPMAAVFRHLPEPLREQISTKEHLTPQQAQELQKKITEEIPNIARQRPWIQWLFLFGLLLWLASLVVNLSVVFTSGPHRRTYAWAGVLVSPILLFLCLCSGIMQRFMGS